MSINEKINKIQKDFFDFDFTDSIIETISFDQNLTNLKIVIDYYFTEKDEESVSIKFRNCSVINYGISDEMYKLNNNQLNYSHFTITQLTVDEKDGLPDIKIYTFDDSIPLINIVCHDVEIQSIV